MVDVMGPFFIKLKQIDIDGPPSIDNYQYF